MSVPNEDNLTAAQVDDIEIAFASMDPISFARHLNSQTCINIPDRLKSELLAASVSQPPKEAADAMSRCMESAIVKFWRRIGARA